MSAQVDSSTAKVDASAMSFANQFLIAMPGMFDSNFSGAVIYVCEHNAQGALGVVVNRPIELTLQELLEKIEMHPKAQVGAQPIMFGGPVQTERGFVLHSPLVQFNSTLQVTTEVGLTTSKDVLQAVADGVGPKHTLVCLGYAGWGPGQLEAELSQNAWLTTEADPEILFTTPHEMRFTAALKLLGVDPMMLSAGAGHA